MEKTYKIKFKNSEDTVRTYDRLRESDFKASLNTSDNCITVITRMIKTDLDNLISLFSYNDNITFNIDNIEKQKTSLVGFHLEFLNDSEGSKYFNSLSQQNGREVLLAGQFKHEPFIGTGYRFKILGYPSEVGPIISFQKLIDKFNIHKYPIKSITYIYDEI